MALMERPRKAIPLEPTTLGISNTIPPNAVTESRKDLNSASFGVAEQESDPTLSRQRLIKAHQTIGEKLRSWYHKTGSDARNAEVKPPLDKGYSYCIPLVPLNLELAVTSILVNKTSSFGQIGLQLYSAAEATLPVALEQICGPYPRWKVSKIDTKIPRGLAKIYVADISKPCILALVRSVDEDIPLLIEIPSLTTAGTLTVADVVRSLLRDKSWGSIQLFSRHDDIQNVPFALIENEIEQLSSTVFFVLLLADPLAYRFRDDHDCPSALLPLKIAFLRCQRLVEAAPVLKTSPLQAIHISGALLHLIISLAEALQHRKMERAMEAYLVSRLEDLVSTLKALYEGIDAPKGVPLQHTKYSLQQFFFKLCEEQPGVVAVRQSFDPFRTLMVLDHQNQGNLTGDSDPDSAIQGKAALREDPFLTDILTSQALETNDPTSSSDSLSNSDHESTSGVSQKGPGVGKLTLQPTSTQDRKFTKGSPHFQFDTPHAPRLMDPEEIERPKGPKPRRNSTVGLDTFFSGFQNMPSTQGTDATKWSPHFQSDTSHALRRIEPQEIMNPQDPKRKRSSMFGFGGTFLGDRIKPSGSSVPRPLPYRPDVAPIDTAARGYHRHDRFGSAVGSPTSPQAQSPWKFAAASPTASEPPFEHGSLSSHHSQPPAFPIPETIKPPNNVAEEPELDPRFNITGFVKDIQRVQETTSSNICKGTYKHVPVAVKAVRNTGGISLQTIRRRFHREFVVWCSLDHPHILPLFGYTEDNGDFGALVSPWSNNGDMTKYLGAGTCQLSLEKRMELVDQVTSALVYLHGLHPVIVHGDLKPGNILLDDRQQAQLYDFGLSRLISEVSTGATNSTAPLGTIRYIAPELVYNSDPYTLPAFPSTESDIYSLASVAYEFIYLQSPYHQYAHPTEILRAISRTEPPAVRTVLHHSEPFSAAQNNFWDLMDQSWSRLPSNRPASIQFRDAFGQIMRIHKKNNPEHVPYTHR